MAKKSMEDFVKEREGQPMAVKARNDAVSNGKTYAGAKTDRDAADKKKDQRSMKNYRAAGTTYGVKGPLDAPKGLVTPGALRKSKVLK